MLNIVQKFIVFDVLVNELMTDLNFDPLANCGADISAKANSVVLTLAREWISVAAI
jgi:hypothetical protein